MRDPIRNGLANFLVRLILFPWGVLVVSAILWTCVLVLYLRADLLDLGYWTVAAWKGTYARWLTLLLWQCFAMAFVTMCVIYLVCALVWGGRQPRYHRRGARRTWD